MKIVNQSKYNNCFIKALFLLTTTLLLFIWPTTVTYASEISIEDNQNVVINTQSGEDTEGKEQASTTDATSNDQGTILGEGYYMGEDGQVYYDESVITIEEPIIEDIVDEEIEEDITVEEVKETVKKSTKDTKKAETISKTSQPKEEKVTVAKKSYSEADLRLLSCLIYSEAGNQSYKGMLAVANVVINRSKSDLFWHVDTIKEVIYDRKWSVQFSVTIKSSKTGLSSLDKALKAYDTGKFIGANTEAQKKSMERAIKAAKAALEGKNNIGGYLCFTNKREASSIKKKYSDYVIIGDHIFYRTK